VTPLSTDLKALQDAANQCDVNAVHDILFPTEPAQESADSLARYVEIEHKLRALEAQVKALEKEQETLAPMVLDEWLERGQHAATLQGSTVYIATDVYCSKADGVDGRTLADALIAAGLGGAVTYNVNTLKAWVKEKVAQAREGHKEFVSTDELINEAIPEEIRSKVRFSEEQRLRVRKASA
jgi:hypothetical protein